MLEVIRDKLRPLFLRKFSLSKQGAHRATVEAGMTARERRLYMSGFEDGWMRGAVDASTVRARDLPRRADSEEPSEVH
jgi:hypothetical protein